MKRRAFVSAALAAPLILAACGGGGGGDPAPTTSAETYQTWAAWVNTLNESGTRTFTISGTVNGIAVSGSGSATYGALAGGNFEGKAALAKTTVLTGSVTANGQTIPYGGTTVSYVDSNYRPLGVTSNEYWVVTGTPTIPQTARVNDAGTLYTANRYASSAKTSLLGTATVSYAVQPDTAATALLRLVLTQRTAGGSVTSTDVQTYRMTPAGALTRLSEEYQEGSSALTLRY